MRDKVQAYRFEIWDGYLSYVYLGVANLFHVVRKHAKVNKDMPLPVRIWTPQMVRTARQQAWDEYVGNPNSNKEDK